ncbi:MAG TPA: TonB family protein [Cyclobacteriaceae bacterium]|jgi:TonB family protein|nr:TonB family protein [Cyclobacteriaceae bacterium]
MRNYIFWVLFFSSYFNSLAQEVKYYTETDVETDSLHSFYFKKGDYSEVNGWTDTVKSYYSKNKRLRSKEFFELGTQQGLGYFYYPNGHLQKKVSYRDGRLVGLANEYFSNGKTKVIKLYASIKTRTFHSYLIVSSWDSLGNPQVKNSDGYYKGEREEGFVRHGLPDSVWVSYNSKGQKSYQERFKQGEFVEGYRFEGEQKIRFEREVSASPKGGLESVYSEIAANIRYPKNARRHGIQGKTMVQFIIEPDGSISNVKIIKGFDRECDDEAVRVVKLFKPWNPGTERGIPVRQNYVLPISFKLSP